MTIGVTNRSRICLDTRYNILNFKGEIASNNYINKNIKIIICTFFLNSCIIYFEYFKLI